MVMQFYLFLSLLFSQIKENEGLLEMIKNNSLQMENQKDNLQEVDLNTRSVDYGQEIKNAEPIKKKKPLKDFKKLAGAAAKNKKLG